jgi:hypothetical protein
LFLSGQVGALAATVGLDQYNCEKFLGDIADAESGEKLLRSMMMISWALGYTAGSERAPRADTEALGLVGNAVGAACRNSPQELVVNVVSRTVSGLASGGEAHRIAKSLPPLPAGLSRWSMEGSVIDLAANGAARKLTMEVPQTEHAKAGAVKGMVLFEGSKSSNHYRGKAYKYSAKCKAVAYDVVGEVSADEKQITLRGKSPSIDGGCKVIGHGETSTVFTFIPTDAN